METHTQVSRTCGWEGQIQILLGMQNWETNMGGVDCKYVPTTGVLVGGGLGGRLPPQMKLHHDLFSMYQQNIERNSSLRMWKCQNFLSSLAPLARIHIQGSC